MKIIRIHLLMLIGALLLTSPTLSQNLLFEKESYYRYTSSDSNSVHLEELPRIILLVDNSTNHQILSSPFLSQTTDHLRSANEQNLFDIESGKGRINYMRAGLLGASNTGAVIYGFSKAISAWGESKGRFHFKDDWRGDNLAQIDELSHLVWGYKMTQFVFCSYRWAGFTPEASHIISITQTAFVLTMVEYPVDAYNPKQGFGVSDLIFDYAGIGMAYFKRRYHWLDGFDIKISSRNNIFLEKQPVFAQTYEEFDNFIYWLTYKHKLFLSQQVFCFGIGYGVVHRDDIPKRELFAGVGLSLPDFASLFHEGLGRRLKFLELFYPNLNIKL